MQPRSGGRGRGGLGGGGYSNPPPSSFPQLSSTSGRGLPSYSSNSSGGGLGDTGYFGGGEGFPDLPPLTSSSSLTSSSNYLPSLQNLTLDPLPPGARRRGSTHSTSQSGLPGFPPPPQSLRRRSSFSRLPGLEESASSSFTPLPPLQPSFLSTTHATSFHLPPLPALIPVSSRTPSRRRNNVNCVCGTMSRDDEMLVCGSCKNESHISCVSSPGLARLLNPFICASCIGYHDRPGGLGGGFASSPSPLSSSFPRHGRSSSNTTNTSMGSSSNLDDFSFNTPPPILSSSSRRSASSSTSSGSSLSSLEPLWSPLSSTASRPGGGIVNPDQKVFENKEQFTMWAKSMFVTSDNGAAPMELKNTSFHTVTLSCRNARRGGNCSWRLRAEMEPSAKFSEGAIKGPFHLRDDATCLVHSDICVDLTAGRLVRPPQVRGGGRPSTSSQMLGEPSFTSSSSLGPLPPLSMSSKKPRLPSLRRRNNVDQSFTDDNLRFEAAQSLGMLASSSSSSLSSSSLMMDDSQLPPRRRRQSSMSGRYSDL